MTLERRQHSQSTIDPTDAVFGDLIASYRFDVGSGTTAYDYAGSNPATFQGDPKWTAFSGANVGQEQAVATDAQSASVGPDGVQLSATSASGDVQLYRHGTADGSLRSDSAPGESFGGVSSERSNLTWGLATPDGSVPTETVLHAPFPNPAQQAATLRYEVPTQADVQIRIYDLLGRQVTMLHRKTVEAGRHEAQLPTGRLASGTYFVRMTAGDTVQTQRLTVVR